MKKFISLSLCLILGLGMMGMVSGCGSKDELEVWSFTSELKDMIEDYYKPNVDKDANIKVTKYTLSSLATKLNNALTTRKNLPDMVALDAKYVLQYIGLGAFESLNDIAGTDQMYAYTKELTTNADGEVEGLSWQATPGAYFYRTDLAKSLLGVNSPAEMQEKVKDWSVFEETAAVLKTNNTHILSSLEEPLKVFLSQREKGWVETKDDKQYFNMDPSLYTGENNAYDLMKTLQQNAYVNTSCDGERSAVWYSDMSSDSVMGYFLSSWGLFYELKENAENATTGVSTAGKWAVCAGPGAFYDGGTWLFVLKGSDKAEEAKKIIRYFTTDETFLRTRATTSGDFINNTGIMTDIKATYAGDPFLGGQNHFELLYDVAEKIDGELIGAYDSTIVQEFKNSVVAYAMGSESEIRYDTVDEAVEGFKNMLRQSSISKKLIIE